MAYIDIDISVSAACVDPTAHMLLVPWQWRKVLSSSSAS